MGLLYLYSITRWRQFEIYLDCFFYYKYGLVKQASWFLLVNVCHMYDHPVNINTTLNAPLGTLFIQSLVN